MATPVPAFLISMKFRQPYLFGTVACLAIFGAYGWLTDESVSPPVSRNRAIPGVVAAAPNSNPPLKGQAHSAQRDFDRKALSTVGSNSLHKVSPKAFPAPSARHPGPALDVSTFSAGFESKGQVAARSSLSSPATAQPSDTVELLAPLSVPYSWTDPSRPATIPAALAAAATGVEAAGAGPPGVERIEQEFLSSVAQGSQDPHDPDYQKAWAEAQNLSDIRMKAAYGDSLWLTRHRDAYRQALGNSQVTRP